MCRCVVSGPNTAGEGKLCTLPRVGLPCAAVTVLTGPSWKESNRSEPIDMRPGSRPRSEGRGRIGGWPDEYLIVIVGTAG